MGWLWNSSDASSGSAAPDQDRVWSAASVPPPHSIKDPPPNTPSETTPQPNSTNPEDPSPELAAFLQALRPPPAKPPTPHTSPSDSSTSGDPLTPLNIYPTTLSCRSAFDTAFYCASLGGQFTSLYRYGALRSCSQQWSDFWFCVRTNRGMYGDEERKMRVLRHEWGKEREKYFRAGGEGEGFGVGGGMRGVSSEDVWEQRERVVGGAFGGDYWGAVEEERRGREGKGVEGGGE